MKRTFHRLGLLALTVTVFLALTGCQLNREEPTEAPPPAETGNNDSASIVITVPAATVTPVGGIAPEAGQPTVASIQPTATVLTTPDSSAGASTDAGQTPTEGTDSGTATDSGTSDSSSTDSSTADTASDNTSSDSQTWTSMPASSGGEIIHVVQPGQNLFRIALQYGMTTDALARYNGIQNPDAIYAGQKLRIPGEGGGMPMHPGQGGQGQIYTVMPGDTLTSIAAKFMVPVNAIMMANNISNADQIYAGQKLVIP